MQILRQGSANQSFETLLSSYTKQAVSGVYHSDEMVANDGSVKPAWQSFFHHLSTLSPEEMTQRFSRGNQYLRNAGVFYRQYDETASTEREWPLSHIPVIIGEDEWTVISNGLVERAELLDYVLQDFYGENDLVSSGKLPAQLLSQNPAWVRPMVNPKRSSKPLLNSISFEIGRGPDGNWWVISDLVEAPSTTGFVIENRIAMSRVFPNYFAQANIQRLAGHFKEFQKMLKKLKGSTDGEVALLSPGPMNQNYAEHAYTARYLGLLLVEGEDLIVQGGKAMVRTIAGLKPIALLWNRLPSQMFDPLELDSSSMLGAAGLVQAIRDGKLKTVNAVGAGVLETRALMAFLPKIAKERLGRPLALSNIATWWCGQEKQREHVIRNAHSMMVGDAFSTVSLMADPNTIVFGKTENGKSNSELTDMLRSNGRNLVGQEAVTLSTTPAWTNDGLVSRPMCIRISLSRTKNGWAVMPGGYARVSAGSDTKALAMQQGGKVADVWVTSSQTVDTPSLLTSRETTVVNRITHELLPSRAADNLFWLGRYVERSEQNMRLFRAYYARLNDGTGHKDALLQHMRENLMDDLEPDSSTLSKLFGDPVKRALQSASRISDRFSPDGIVALRELIEHTRILEKKQVPLADITFEVSGLLRQITGFAGLVHENMYRSDGWRFLSVGSSLERAANMCSILATCCSADAPSGALDLALELGDSAISYRSRFQISANFASIIDLLALDPKNPRSVRYHVIRTKEHIAELPFQEGEHSLSDVARQVLLLETQLATTDPEAVTTDILMKIQQDIWAISDTLAASHLA